jgi:transcriptional regulator with XRE-family HTH domain
MRDEHIEKIMGGCLGQAICEHRERKKLTQVDLAKKLGRKHGSAVSDIEHGEKRITVDELVVICKKLEVPFLDVIDQAILFFRKKVAELGEEKGGFLLGSPPVTREEVESGFVSLTGSANEWMSKLLQFAHPPTDQEKLRSNFRKAPARDEE